METNVITLEGKKYAVVPFPLFKKMRRDAEDAEDVKEATDIQAQIKAGKMPTYPESVAISLINGENPIKVFRGYRGLSQIELANKIGVDLSCISKIETCDTIALDSTVKAISTALDVDANLLIS